MRVDPVAADQVEAIGDGGEDGVETGADGRGFARQIDDQALAAQHRFLP